jgi:hypothetical protein
MDKPKRPWYVWVIGLGLLALGVLLLLTNVL